MPELEAFFHYRNIDVSTIKELAARWRPSVLDAVKKNNMHQALEDVVSPSTNYAFIETFSAKTRPG